VAKRWGAIRRGNEIGRVRSVFKYGFEAGLIQAPVRFGPEFVKPSARTVRVERARVRRERGEKMLTPKQLRDVLAIASPQIEAMILLGANCGMGATDCGELTAGALDLDAGWLDYPRGKTGIDRRCPLWPETVEAIRLAMAERPAPLDAAHKDRVFITPRGWPWVRQSDKTHLDAVGVEFAKLLKAKGIKTSGRFYVLRHVFQTIGEEPGDLVAVRRIMGHADESMAAAYREWTRDRREDDRLRRVTDHVHAWLYGGIPADGRASA
jgi:integrase